MGAQTEAKRETEEQGAGLRKNPKQGEGRKEGGKVGKTETNVQKENRTGCGGVCTYSQLLEAEAGGSGSSGAEGQPEQHGESLSEK